MCAQQILGPGAGSTGARSSRGAARALARKVISLVPFGRALARSVLSLGFRGSPTYWETRYATGRNSGVGSYGHLAEFKGEFLRRFMRDNDIRSVIDYGCGDGNQIGFLENVSYVGLDVSATAIEMCRHKYRDDPTKTFVLYRPDDRFEDLPVQQADISISLDVIYHLVEDHLFQRYIANLFASARRFVVVYSSNRDEIPESPHVRHRKVTSYIKENVPGWTLRQCVENPYKGESSGSDFFVFRSVKEDIT